MQTERMVAHSCAHVFSMVFQYNMDDSSKSLLCYHTANKDKSSLVYSGGSMAGQLRKLVAMIVDVKKGVLVPDATRSGHFPGRETT